MHNMHVAQATPEALAGIDLNLLVAFDALARERNVTKAAARVGLSQSAMSHALGRLRQLLDDPLLVRGRGGMALTPRAEALAVPLRSGLVTIHRALSDAPSFDAATAQRSFRITSPDLFDVLMLPPMLERIRADAPAVDLTVMTVMTSGLAESLQTGELDVAVLPRFHERRSAPDQGPTASGLVRRTLFRDRFVVLVRADHSVLHTKSGRPRKKLSLPAYLELSHAMVSPGGSGSGPVDRALTSRGAQRRVGLRLPSFAAALAIVARSDLALTTPTGLARVAPPDPGIAILPPPLPLPEHSIDLVWHERFSNDPGHVWLRELMADVAEREMADDRTKPREHVVVVPTSVCDLTEYARISIAFEVTRVLDVPVGHTDTAMIELAGRPRERPYVKDYDTLDGGLSRLETSIQCSSGPAYHVGRPLRPGSVRQQRCSRSS